MKFNENLRNLRKETNKTMAEVASDLGVHSDLLGKYERGRNEPCYEFLIKLADYYGVSIDFLLRGENREEITISKEEYLKLIKFNECLSDVHNTLNTIKVRNMDENNNN